MLGFEIIKIKQQLVQVADGREVLTEKMCKGFKWLMQGAVFQDNLFVFPIGNCDLVLGIQWLCPLEDVKFSFRKLIIEFEYHGKLLTLQGVQPKLKAIQAKNLEKMNTQGSKLFMVRVRETEGAKEQNNELKPIEELEEIRTTLAEYNKVFGEPTQLPPSRGVFDHYIPLMEGSSLVNARPYRYSPIQKDVIERLVRE